MVPMPVGGERMYQLADALRLAEQRRERARSAAA
jgi:hypothetical protein